MRHLFEPLAFVGLFLSLAGVFEGQQAGARGKAAREGQPTKADGGASGIEQTSTL